LLSASRDNNAKEYFPFTPSLDALDVVFVHDLSPDNVLLPGPWEEQFEIARTGAFPALSRMRDEGMIKGWGLGVNSPEPILKSMDVADANVRLPARQYSLIDHEYSLHHVFPTARERGMAFVVGSSLNAGFFSGGACFNYGKENRTIPSRVIEKRARLALVTDELVSLGILADGYDARAQDGAD
jgi:D-threo-aldose 1-dehydrogenase